MGFAIEGGIAAVAARVTIEAAIIGAIAGLQDRELQRALD
jgi:hypothetical protein